MSAPDCPRCGSSETEEDVKTGPPSVSHHDYGCDECMFVWDEADDF